MKRTARILTRVACLAAFGLLAVFPQAALACGYACVLVSTEPFCLECQYVGGGGGGCIQYDVCSCYEVQCAVTPEEETAASILDFLPVDLEPAGECTDAAGSALVAD